MSHPRRKENKRMEGYADREKVPQVIGIDYVKDRAIVGKAY